VVIVVAAISCSSGSGTESTPDLTSGDSGARLTPTPTPNLGPNRAVEYVNEIALLSGENANGGKFGDREFTPMAGLTGEEDFLVSQAISSSKYEDARDHIDAVLKRIFSSGTQIRSLSPPASCKPYHTTWIQASDIFLEEVHLRETAIDYLIAGDFDGSDKIALQISPLLRQKSEITEDLYDHWGACMAAAYPESYGDPTPTPQVYVDPTSPVTDRGGESGSRIDGTGGDRDAAAYLEQAVSMFQLLGSSQVPSGDLENLDWQSEQRRLIEAREGIEDAKKLFDGLSPPESCEDFHSVMVRVLDDLAVVVEYGITIAGFIANGNILDAYEVSSNVPNDPQLYADMSTTWDACHSAIDLAPKR